MSYGKVLTDDGFQKIKVVGRFHCKIWVGLFRSSDTELELGACPAWKTHFIQCGRNTREDGVMQKQARVGVLLLPAMFQD